MMTRTVKINVRPSDAMIASAIAIVANHIESRDKIPTTHRVACIATGAINSAGRDYTMEIPLRDFVQYEHDIHGQVKIHLAPVRQNETDVYTEISEPPSLTGEQMAEIQDAVDRIHTTAVLPLGALRCTAEDLQAYIGLSFQFGSNPLPTLRSRLAEAGEDIELHADRFGDTVTIRYR